MKKKYNKILLLVPLILMVVQVIGQVPDPDVLYRFDETTGNVIADSSGNNYHAWWYNYNGENPGTADRTGWRPTDGYRKGAGYFNGTMYGAKTLVLQEVI
jgi:hypothetical protein